MEEGRPLSRAEIVQRLQALAKRVESDREMTLVEISNYLESLITQIRHPALTTTALPAAAGADGVRAGSGALPGGAPDGEVADQPAKKQRRAPREFDFSRYRTRFVALELMYVGWAFQGFARQDNTENTIEGVLFSALRKVKLIPEAAAVPISELQYSRCGRTDRGVSALGQVVALRLRSCARVDEPEAPLDREFDYPRLINKALPLEVRVLGWAPAAEDFNARFSAQYREYKYFIVQQRLAPPPTGPSPSTSHQHQHQQQQQPPVQAPAPTQTAVQMAPPAAVVIAAAGGQGPGPAASTSASADDDPGGPAIKDGSEERMAGGGDEDAQDHSGRRPPDDVLAGVSSPQSAATATRALPPDGGSGGVLGAGASGARWSYSLDIEAMRRAAALFVGEHDFRNFCKPDVATVRSFRRRILSFTIEPVSTSSGEGSHQVYALRVRGTAFLWHQVRCMAAVLLMVGRGQERPEVVSALLDVEATPRKPQYSMAPEEPLLLYACGFTDLSFRRSGAATEATLGDVAGLLHRHLIGAALTCECHTRLAADERCAEPPGPSAGGRGAGGGGGAAAAAGHIPLLRRQTEPSIEERMARRGIPWPPEDAAEGRRGAGGEADEGDPMVE